MPGSLEPEALFFRETEQQSAALDTAWGERHSVVHKLGVRMQREFSLPIAEHIVGETIRVEGKLAAIERGEDNRHRAVIVTASHIHIVSVSSDARQQLEIGKGVALEKTAGRLRLMQGPEPDLAVARRQDIGLSRDEQRMQDLERAIVVPRAQGARGLRTEPPAPARRPEVGIER
jgi:hypothetical protein